MINDIEMLKTITETADMGRDSLNHVLDKANNTHFKTALQRHYKQYDNTYKMAEKLLHDKDKSPSKISAPIKMYSHAMTNLKTITAENTDSEIAEMVIQGTTMGITEMIKQLNDYEGTDLIIRALAQNHIESQQTNINETKSFL